MAPNTAVRLINSQAPQPELLVPTKETIARVANNDQEQRAKTDRARGWYDYKLVFDQSYGLQQRLAKFVPEFLEESLSTTYSGSEFDSWTVVPDPEATLLYPFLANSKHTDCVLNLTGVPPSFSRMPNFAAVNKAYQSADCVVILANQWSSPEVQVEYTLRSGGNAVFSKPKPIVYLMPSVPCEQFNLENKVLAEKRAQAQEMLKEYPEVLVLEMDFSDRSSISKGLQQLVQYLKSGKGVIPKDKPLDKLDLDFTPAPTAASSFLARLFSSSNNNNNNNNNSTPRPAKSLNVKQASPPAAPSTFSFLNNLFNRK